MKVNNHTSNLPEWLDAFTSVASTAFGFNKTAEDVVKVVDSTPTTVDNLQSFEWEGEKYTYKQVDKAGLVYNNNGIQVARIDNATGIQDAINKFNGDRVITNNEIEVEDDEQIELIDDALEDVDECIEQGNSADYGFKELKADIQSLKRTVEALSAQQYARMEIPNNVYDLNCQEDEVAHFNEAAQVTQTVINAEHALDLSTQTGRGQLNYEFLQALFPGNPEIQQSIINNIEAQLQQTNESDVIEDTDDNINDNRDEEIPVIESEETTEDTQSEDTQSEDTQSEDIQSEDTQSEDIQSEEIVEKEPIEEISEDKSEQEQDNRVLLDDPDDLELVQEDHICPFCGEQLELDDYKEDDEFSTIHCTSCNKQYEVDMNTGNIFYINSED